MKRPKHYPMDGPSLRIQQLMESPRKNRAELVAYFLTDEGKKMRSETRNVIHLK